MSKVRHFSIALTLAALVASAGYLRAQAAEGEIPDVTVPDDEEIAELSGDELRERATDLIGAMQAIHEHTVELQSSAREGRDVIRLNCVNEKLLEIKQLLNIAEASRSDFVEASVAADDASTSHHFSQIAIAYESIDDLGEEAKGCVGERAVFHGESQIDFEGPDLLADPTAEPPFPDFEISDPGYGSGYY